MLFFTQTLSTLISSVNVSATRPLCFLRNFAYLVDSVHVSQVFCTNSKNIEVEPHVCYEEQLPTGAFVARNNLVYRYNPSEHPS